MFKKNPSGLGYRIGDADEIVVANFGSATLHMWLDGAAERDLFFLLLGARPTANADGLRRPDGAQRCVPSRPSPMPPASGSSVGSEVFFWTSRRMPTATAEGPVSIDLKGTLKTRLTRDLFRCRPPMSM